MNHFFEFPLLTIKDPTFASVVVPATMTLMAELENDESWQTELNLAESDDWSSPSVVGEQAMDRFSKRIMLTLM